MQKKTLEIVSNRALAPSTYEITLKGEGLRMHAGQFVEFKADGFFLRRPLSVAACDDDTLTLIYKLVGEGTKAMSKACVGGSVDVLTHLGCGFLPLGCKKPLLIGGGIGSVPLYQLARDFSAAGLRPTIVLGFRNAEEVFYENEFAKLGDLHIATDDGSYGEKGNAVSLTKALCREQTGLFDRYFACGPVVMLKNLQSYSANGQISMEARMGCGFGACMGCSIVTTEGFKRVCKEGPVFEAQELIFD